MNDRPYIVQELVIEIAEKEIIAEDLREWQLPLDGPEIELDA